MKSVKINLYSFGELNEKARQKAIDDHINFMDSIEEEYEDENGEMQSEYINHFEADAIDSIEANEYLFYYDGTLANCTTYVGKHPKNGTTEFNLHGEIFELTNKKIKTK